MTSTNNDASLQQDHDDDDNNITDDTTERHERFLNTQQLSPKEEPTAAAATHLNPTELVPQLSSSNITYGELQTTIKVMNAIAALHPKNGNRKPNDHTEKASDTTSASTAATTTTTTSTNIATANRNDGIELYKQSNLRPFRKALSLCMEMHQRTMYNGRSEQDHYDNRKQERSLKRQKMSEKDLYRKHIETTALRKGRVDKLQAALQEYEQEERLKLEAMMIPDGHVDANTTTDNTGTIATTSLLLQNQGDEGHDKDVLHQDLDQLPPAVVLPCLRSCYVCKIRYRELHFFYDQLCPTCAALNYEKRYQTTSLDRRVAVVTGARVKIGYQTCLKLLRANCTVIATTRFPNAAIDAYRKESDFHHWKHLLFVYGLDLRDVIGIEIFTRYVKQQFATSGIDIIVNNACQTIRRPCGYYQPAIQKEQTIWKNADSTHKALLSSCIAFEQLRRQQIIQSKEQPLNTAQLQPDTNESNAPPQLLTSDEVVASNMAHDTNTIDSHMADAMVTHTSSITTTTTNAATTTPSFEVTGISHSAAMSQMIILPEDVGVNDEILPPGISDINGQQLDLRTSNSWLLKMEQVSTPEFMECMYINAMAPFVLNSRLKPLMTYPNTDDRPDRFIINVSAMEGKVCIVHRNIPK